MLPELAAAQGMLKYLHHRVKTDLQDLDAEGLNWTPPGVDETNSIYGLALHIASTQVAFAGALVGEPLRLDIPELTGEGRKAHAKVLKSVGDTADTAISYLRQAAQITNEVFERVTPEMLEREAILPGGSKGIGHNWVQLMMMHGGEHIGHMGLTRQLYFNSQQSAVGSSVSTSGHGE